LILTIAAGACAGTSPPEPASLPATQPASDPPPSTEPAWSTEPSPSAAATPSSLLPDGVWQVELTATDLAGAEPGVFQPGVYRFVFDGTRARISLADGTACDADAAARMSAIQLTWHLCGGSDTVRWRIEADGLHLGLVTSGSGNPQGTRAILERRPWQPVAGDAHLDWSTAWVTCGNPDGGACRNAMSAGTYTTDAFLPGLTYTVPGGWQNLSDLPGEVFFLAPDYTIAGMDAGDNVEDIAVLTSVRAENRRCGTAAQAESDEPGVAHTPEAMAAEFQARPGLRTSTPQAVSIGGLTGLVMDIRMAPGWTGKCYYWPDPVVQLIAGVRPSEFEHPVIAGLTMRLYLLARGTSTLAVEVDDFSDGAHLDRYSKIVDGFAFGG
jgi:hypothetical protein